MGRAGKLVGREQGDPLEATIGKIISDGRAQVTRRWAVPTRFADDRTVIFRNCIIRRPFEAPIVAETMAAFGSVGEHRLTEGAQR